MLQKQYNWPKGDARITTLIKFKNLIEGVHVGFILRNRSLEKSFWWKHYQYLGVDIEDDKKFQDSLIHEYDTVLRIAFGQNLFVVIESSLRIFMRELMPNCKEKTILLPLFSLNSGKSYKYKVRDMVV